jgi:oligosaccharyltransferase complex subunit beta
LRFSSRLVASDQKDLLGSDKFDPVLFRGASFTLKAASAEAGLLFPILRARSSAYPQPRAVLDARVVISGSTALFSDKLFNSRVESATGDVKADRSGNERFVTELSKWALKERGVLRASNARHHRFAETVEASTYRVTDNVTFEVDIEQWDSETGKWAPFVSNDVQLEFIMLDPYVRQFFKADKKGHYALDFLLPDQHGVYTFRVDYHKFGYSSIQIESRVPVRPFRHNEYERFIFSAYPYYAGSFSMLAGIIIFSFVFLYHRSK